MRAAVVITAALAVLAPQAQAVIILDSTWRQEGGARGREWAGFAAHLRLAAEPQFKPVLAFATDGKTWGEASGTWIGNDAGHAYILTAAHIYTLPGKPDDYSVRGPDGQVHHADRLWIHPKWYGDTDTQTGFDIAILRLPEPLTNAGPQPSLYAGAGEAGQLVTFVGYGSRGIGSTGQQDQYYRGSDKAAAQGIAEQWKPMAARPRRDQDSGNYFGVYLPKEDGSIPNPYGGESKPASRLVGLLGSGDSGGSVWMPVGSGWTIVGINSSGDGSAKYGESSWFSRVSAHKDWISKIFPGAQFAD